MIDSLVFGGCAFPPVTGDGLVRPGPPAGRRSDSESESDENSDSDELQLKLVKIPVRPMIEKPVPVIHELPPPLRQGRRPAPVSTSWFQKHFVDGARWVRTTRRAI